MYYIREQQPDNGKERCMRCVRRKGEGPNVSPQKRGKRRPRPEHFTFKTGGALPDQ
jgi:hypothetical protein